jgi:hypothetical protein
LLSRSTVRREHCSRELPSEVHASEEVQGCVLDEVDVYDDGDGASRFDDTGGNSPSWSPGSRRETSTRCSCRPRRDSPGIGALDFVCSLISTTWVSSRPGQ